MVQGSLCEQSFKRANGLKAIQVREICPNCGVLETVRDVPRGEIICTNCGLVLDAHLIDYGPEWRAFTKQERDKRQRVGNPPSITRFDKGLSTDIDWRNRDARNKSIAPSRLAEVYRLRKWHKRSRVHSNFSRNLAFALGELTRIASQLNLPYSVKESAAHLYRRALEQKMTRGRSLEGVMAACIYVACRFRSIPLTLKEVSVHSHLDRKQLAQSSRMLVRKLELQVPTPRASDYIPRFAEALKLDNQVILRSLQIISDARRKMISSGKAPTSIAASCLYIACILEGVVRTQREISKVTGVTEVTIRNRYKEIINRLKISFDLPQQLEGK